MAPDPERIASAADVHQITTLLLGRASGDGDASAGAAERKLVEVFDDVLAGAEFHAEVVEPVLMDGSSAVGGLLQPPSRELLAWSLSAFRATSDGTPPTTGALLAACLRRRRLNLTRPAADSPRLSYLVKRLETPGRQELEPGSLPRADEETRRTRLALVARLRPGEPEQALAVRALALLDSGAIDPSAYLARNPDVAAAKFNPVLHYLLHGDEEGRSPSAGFDPPAYRARHGLPPLVNALEHALAHHPEEVGSAPATPNPATLPRRVRSDGRPPRRPAPERGKHLTPQAGRGPRHVATGRVTRRLERLRGAFGAETVEAHAPALLDLAAQARSSPFATAALLDDLVLMRSLIDAGEQEGTSLATEEAQLAALGRFCLYRGEGRRPEELQALSIVAGRLQELRLDDTRWPTLPLTALVAAVDLALRPLPLPLRDLDTDGRSAMITRFATRHARLPDVQALLGPMFRQALRTSEPDFASPLLAQMARRGTPTSEGAGEKTASWMREVWSGALDYALSGPQLDAVRLDVLWEAGAPVLQAPRETSHAPLARLIADLRLSGVLSREQMRAASRSLPPNLLGPGWLDFPARPPDADAVARGADAPRLPTGEVVRFDRGSRGALFTVGPSWGAPEPDRTWTLQPTALLVFSINAEPEDAWRTGLDLRLRLALGPQPERLIRVRWDGLLILELDGASSGFESYIASVPSTRTGAGRHVVTLSVDGLVSAAESAGHDQRELGIAVSDMTLIAR